MKKELILILLLVSSKVYSQNRIPNYELGYYHDVNKQIIDGYYDIDYELTKALKVSHNIGDDFTPGYYYDLRNNKISGLLKYSQSNTYFTFKKDNKNREVKTLKPGDCLGFVIGADTFAVIENFKAQRDISGLKSMERDFAEVIEQFGNLTFYKHIRIFINNTIVTYLVKADSSKNFMSFPAESKKFKAAALQIFGEFRSLKEQIVSEKYTDEDVPVLAKLLKYKRKYDHHEKILYNASWDEVDEISKSMYYATIKSLKDSVFHLSFHFNNGITIYEGDFTSFFPHRKLGEFIWYYPNGNVRKKIKYVNNKPEKTTTYFCNGNIHYEYKTVKKTLFYDKVNANDKTILDSLGNGTETFRDSIAGRQITNQFLKNRLVNSYFLDSTNKKIYQVCDKNARLKTSLEFRLGRLDYPVSSLKNFAHGYLLFRCIIEPSGLTSKIQILKGIDQDCDSVILNVSSFFKTTKQWYPAKNKKVKVTQELIIPIEFSIKGFSIYRNNYNNSWMVQQMMRDNMYRMQQPKIPTYKF